VLGGAQAGSLAVADILLPLQENLHLAPADLAMANVEMGLAQRMGREYLLKKALSKVEELFDLVFIDCGPSLGLLTINGLVAASQVIVPCQPSILDLRGVSLFMQSIETVRKELNPELDLFGVLVTQFDPRYTHHRDAVDTMLQAGLPVIPVLIGRSVKVAEASGASQPIIHYEPRNPQSESYLKLADVIEEWLSK
jgi:chromosome partitioning protein